MEHDYFGAIADGPSGLEWSETLELGDQSVRVDLRTDSAVDMGDLDRAAAVLSALEGLDESVREAMVADLGSGSVVSRHLDDRAEELGDELDALLVGGSGDRAIDLLKGLSLVSVVLRPDQAGEGETFAIFEYSIDPDLTDATIIATIDSGGSVTGLESLD